LSSPALTGTPTAPTAAQSVNNTQIATTAFVKSAIAGMVGSAPAALDTLNELAAALGNDPNFATTMLNALAGKQPLDNTLTNLSGKDVAGLLTYLGLGEAAKRNVGTGANQIPDMSLFASINTVAAAAQKFPSGLILQCGQLNGAPNVSSTYGMRFPMTFSRVIAVVVTLNVTGAAGQPTVSATSVQNTGFNITVSPGSGYGSSADAYYIAMGY
jgi:phage-related tail fiber protein